MKSTQNAKILIVEDEGIISNHLASRLLIAGYDVTGIAQSAEEALERIREDAPALILMDIHIKGAMDGVDATLILREHSDIPVIYLTAHSDQKTIDRAKLTGAAGFLTKPIQFAALGHAIEMALNNRHYQEVRSQRAWMRTVLGKIKEAIIVINKDRKIEFLNGPAEALTGWRDEAARGLDVECILPIAPPRQGSPMGGILEFPLESRPSRQLPIGALASNYSGHWARLEGEIAPSMDGERVVGAVIQFGDAISRREHDAGLRHDSKMRAVGRLTAGVAHDFNNLVFIILGYTNELLEKSKPGIPESDALSKIRKAGVSAASIAEQLLTFSRKVEREKKEVNLNDVIRGEEDTFQRLGGRGVEFEFRLDPGIGAIWAEEGQLQQILTNLVTNARDAMPGGGKITIETLNSEVPTLVAQGRDAPRAVRLRVADTGTGMSTDTAKHLFEPFFSTKDAGKGTGLGLAIVHNIVEDLGGTIRAGSQPGKGAVFTMWIPAAPGTEEIQAAPSWEVEEAETGMESEDDGAATVLLIEDEPDVRHLIRDYLTSGGYRVLEAGSGEEGICVANEHRGRIDLLVSDVVMPNMGGFETALALAHARPALKTLFISGYAADFLDGQGKISSERLSAGTRFLLKPFVRKEFLKNVRGLLGREVAMSARAH